jgi:hypothetical protein
VSISTITASAASLASFTVSATTTTTGSPTKRPLPSLESPSLESLWCHAHGANRQVRQSGLWPVGPKNGSMGTTENGGS